MNLKTIASAAAIALTAAACAPMDMNDDMVMNEVSTVGGAEMFASRNIIENAVNSPIHTTLVSAVKQAQLVDTLSGPGPFTVFAPTDEAFGKVPQSMLNSVMMDENRAMLQGVLTYHVVPGRVTAADLMSRIRAGNGRTMITTVNGDQLTFMMMNGMVHLMGKNGTMANVTQADVMQSNGIIHVIDGVLLPSM